MLSNQIDEVFEPLFASAVVTEVVGVLKSGKEATVYVARAGADLLAVKVYTPRDHRSFKNAAAYDDGRQILDERMARAAKNKSSFGGQVLQGTWIAREYARLHELYEVGVAVPRPVTMSGSAIVMQYLGDADGAAPRLRDVELTPTQARESWKWLRYDIESMLGANVVHADLSPYNILWWQDRTWIIDLPQAVDPRFNRNAKAFLERDLRNCAKYFGRSGVTIDPVTETIDLWRRFMRAEL